jgi:hypothetical protein
MKLTATRIVSCLWFDSEAEEAARFYVSIFENSRMRGISHYGEEGYEIHGRKAGTVMTAEFEIAGQNFVALNGGPHIKFSEAMLTEITGVFSIKLRMPMLLPMSSTSLDGRGVCPCAGQKQAFGLPSRSWDNRAARPPQACP